MDLSTTYLGLKLTSPLMPGASPMVDDMDTVRRLEEAGASAINIDLKDVLATRVELKTGASSSNIALPARGASALDVEAGAASVDIRVPEAVPARIRVEEGVTSINVDTNRFPRLDSRLYQSANYDAAMDRAEINIKSGLGSVSVH